MYALYTKEKKLYVWGYNNNGQLGIGNTTNQNTPQEVTTVTFDGTGVGEIKKVQMLNRSSDLSVGILTEREHYILQVTIPITLEMVTLLT